MATYFHGNSENQGGGGSGGDGLQTLILMNPSYIGYSDAQPPGNLVFLNSSSSGGGGVVHHAPPHSQGQHFVGIPLQGGSDAPGLQQQDASPGFLPRVHYNLYNLPVDIGAARAHHQQQGLSLSLSSQQPPGYGSFRSSRDDPTPQPTSLPANEIRASPSPASGVSNGVNSVLLGSKYLLAAQELLDEVVNVGAKGAKILPESSKLSNTAGDPTETAASNGEEGGGNSKPTAELTTAERQEIQMKKAKLVNMLDEVEERYRQYYHQMQIVILWFEQAAGIGSAKTYTALALQTISKQFRCLKDVIMVQIRTASKNLGEADAPEGKIHGSRLKYVDTQIRQQRALQQLGMIQHNAWRPQRGLPERSVSVLRAWLFEHFLHPYPKDSDKQMLAKQTGLTRSQVSNWFINARVRLWKPMVEEMYLEEMKEHGKAGPDDNPSRTENNVDHPNPTTKSVPISQTKNPNTDAGSMTKQNNNNMNQSNPPAMPMKNFAGFNLIGSSEVEGITQGSPKKIRSTEILHAMNMDNKPSDDDSNDHISMKFSNDRQPGRDDSFTLMGEPTNFIGGFGSYFTGAEQFQAPYPGNGSVSLTLGLPHCDNLVLPASHQTFLPNQAMQLGRGVELGEANDFTTINTPTNTHTTNVYDSINIQNRKSFAAQLLPDFVA